ncbi:MAG TPA: alpha-ketoglutarate-dependent dioxygenase AlkB [Cellvibrionaceae bacterium]|nr:alpha-ketoglutarate-dependent dioxygenase AlkB [Cellvibrionaceae bacterium]
MNVPASCQQVSSPSQVQPAIECIEQFYSLEESAELYKLLVLQQQWPDNHYSLAGRTFTLPRKQTWHADPGIHYSYSNNLLKTRPWTPLLTQLRHSIQTYLNFEFNSVLVNWYRNGEDYVGWHADDEAELGPNPLIASLSLGASRTFSYKHKYQNITGNIQLTSGSLLIMQPSVQHQWQHAVLPEPEITEGRINMTFRRVLTRAELMQPAS